MKLNCFALILVTKLCNFVIFNRKIFVKKNSRLTLFCRNLFDLFFLKHKKQIWTKTSRDHQDKMKRNGWKKHQHTPLMLINTKGVFTQAMFQRIKLLSLSLLLFMPL